MMNEQMHKYRFLARFLPNSTANRLVVLTGARQTGKTTLAKIHYPQLRYINFDSQEDREAIRQISSLNWRRDVGNAIIDEAQKEPAVFEKVKYAFDEKSISFTLLLGSSQILLLKKTRESLAGRAYIFELWPLMLSELCYSSEEEDVPLPLIDEVIFGNKLGETLQSRQAVLLGQEAMRCKDAESYLLQWGGMPALLGLSAEERWKWLKDYEYTYLERDLADLARLDDLEPFKKFQKLSALRSAKLLNYSELARDSGISVDTARRYLEYLRLSYQVILLQPYARNITSSVIKTPKLYWVDVGLMRQLSGYRGQIATGEIYETAVVAETIKWIKSSQRDCEAYFYRTRSGSEIDMLLQSPSGIIGIEAKARGKVYIQDAKPLKEVAARLGNEWRGGLIVYQGNEIRKICPPDIWAVPSNRLFSQ
jgi:predicted AAA+ superfamily ATPase